MTRTWAELLLLAALLAAAWLAFGHGLRAPAAPAGVATGAWRPIDDADPVGAGLTDRARALRTYLAAPPARVTVRRNPFVFPAPPRPAGGATAQHAVEAAPVEPRPELTLSGIAEDAAAGGTVRTAVIAAAGQLFFAKEGDRVLSRFVVLRIAADAVQVKDTERGEVFTLVFK